MKVLGISFKRNEERGMYVVTLPPEPGREGFTAEFDETLIGWCEAWSLYCDLIEAKGIRIYANQDNIKER